MTAAFWKQLAKRIVMMIFPKVAGLGGWILSLILEYGGRALYDLASVYLKKLKRDVAQKEAIEKKDEVINNPNHTADEAGKAYQDMFNAGKKK
jgi:hypothetical protein